MKIAITGATGFVGQALVRRLIADGHTLRCWKRDASRTGYAPNAKLEWIVGELGNSTDSSSLVSGCDALVHAAFWRPGTGFRGAEGDLVEFARKNVLGSLQLFEAAHHAKLQRVIFVSSCSVHEEILPNRPLDEFHPLIAKSHYGAHKAAVEAFLHSFARTNHLNISAVRPTGIYGVSEPVEGSKWYGLISKVVRGESVECRTGGKEVHVDDVAKSISILLDRHDVSGQVFACYDRYVSEWEVAQLAKRISGSNCEIGGQLTSPKNQIDTSRIRSLGMTFGGTSLLEATVKQLVNSIAQVPQNFAWKPDR